MLATLGFSDDEEAVYRELLVASGLQLPEVTRRTRLPASRAQKAVRGLEDKGLVARSPEQRPRFTAAPPDIALEGLIAQQEENLARARRSVLDLIDQFRASAAHGGRDSPVELVRGHPATLQRWAQVQRAAKHEVRIIDRPPYVIRADHPNPEELVLLARGLRYRVLYDESSFDTPGKLASALACVDGGEEARVLPATPIKLILADERLALTYAVRGDVENGLLVEPSSLLDALSNLFELLWRSGTPLMPTGRPREGGEDLDDVDRQILAFMAAGVKDESIARRLDLGVRTVRRRISHLMERVDAATRFQAGVHAAQRGLLS